MPLSASLPLIPNWELVRVTSSGRTSSTSAFAGWLRWSGSCEAVL